MGLFQRFRDNLRYAIIQKNIKETDTTHYGFIEELNEQERTVKFRYMDLKTDQTTILQMRVKEIDPNWRPLVLNPVLVKYDTTTRFIDFEKPIPSNDIEKALISDVETWIRKFAREKEERITIR